MHQPVKYKIYRPGTQILMKTWSKLGAVRILNYNTTSATGISISTSHFSTNVRQKRYKSHLKILLSAQYQLRELSLLTEIKTLPYMNDNSPNVNKIKKIKNGLEKSVRKKGTHSENASPNVSLTPSDTTQNYIRVTESKMTALYPGELFESGAWYGEDDPLTKLRNILYPEKLDMLAAEEEEHDPLFRLSNASSVKEIFTIFSEMSEDDIKPHHTAQAISTFSYLGKLSTVAMENLDEMSNRKARIEYNRLLTQELEYIAILDRLKNLPPKLSIDVVAYLFQALRKLGEPLSSPLMVNFVTHLVKHINKMDSKALSYFAIGISGRESPLLEKVSVPWGLGCLRKQLSLAPAVPRLDEFIEQMRTAEDVYQVAICMFMMSNLLSDKCMTKFYCRLNDVIKKGEFNQCCAENLHNSTLSWVQTSAIVKILSIYLTKKDWHLSRGEKVRNVLYLLKGRFNELRPDQLVVVARVTQELGEPVSILYELDRTIRKLFEMQKLADAESSELYSLSESVQNKNSQNLSSHLYNQYIPRVDFLHSMIVAKLGPVDETTTKTIVIASLQSQLFPIYISQIFDILRISELGNDQMLVKQFLEQAFEVCQQDMLDLCRLSTRYMNFNSSKIGIVRDREFENKVIKVFETNIMINPNPVAFAAQFGFLLSYSDYIEPKVFNRFQYMIEQLRPFHLYTIARGLETRFSWIPQSIPKEYRPKNYRDRIIKGFPISVEEQEKSRSNQIRNTEMEKMFCDVDVAVNIQSLRLLSSGIKDPAITEKLPQVNIFHKNLPKHKNEGEMVKQQIHGYNNRNWHSQNDFASVFLIFKNFVCRRTYLDKQGFTKVMDSMLEYLEHTQLTLTVIRQIAVALCNLKPQHNLTTLVEKMITYILDNRNHVHTRTIFNPLILAYQSSDEVLKSAKGKSL